MLASFVKPDQMLGADEVIPPHVLKNAKGLAIITVLKAGFLFSGRAGSGVIVARLADGRWSSPSAIALAGAGAGGMVGVELTDFVFILNTADAVKSFSHAGSITLGGNISVAAGPLGRNAEAAATASLGSVAAVFSYSKTKGLFAGVTLEGSVIIERREANRKFYGSNCTAKAILSGSVSPPPGVDPLFRVLRSRAFNHTSSRSGTEEPYFRDDDYYGDIPSNLDSEGNSRRNSWRNSFRRSRHGVEGYHDDVGGYDGCSDDDNVSDYYTNRRRGDGSALSNSTLSGNLRSSTKWEDDEYDQGIVNTSGKPEQNSQRRAPARPTSAKPDFGSHSTSSGAIPKAVALYTFKGEQKGDLPFRKGDVIMILKRTESQDDWWTGRINGQEGIFPANYVDLV